MITAWDIRIHKLVFKEDLKSISSPDQKIIFKDIRKKLSVDPHGYGKPLTGGLRGYWRLRVRDYRVIYKIADKLVEVLVVKIGIRRNDEVYKEFLPRVKKLLDN